jgi:hypothetical protein
MYVFLKHGGKKGKKATRHGGNKAKTKATRKKDSL